MNAKPPCPVLIQGPLTVHTCQQWKERLLAELDRSSALHVDATGIDEADTCGVQLLLSSEATARIRAVPFSLVSLSEPLRRAFRSAGLDAESRFGGVA